jgi:hypothetical protein
MEMAELAHECRTVIVVTHSEANLNPGNALAAVGSCARAAAGQDGGPITGARRRRSCAGSGESCRPWAR